MARQVLPILGGVVGAFFGMPQLGFAIGSVVGAVIDPGTTQGPKLGELAVQRSNEGMPRAIIYGTATCTGYILDFGPPIKTTETVTGEKGAPKSEQEVVYRNYAIAICEGPILGVLRVWENDKLVYDVRPGSLMLAESEKWKQNKVFYAGSEDQLPDVFLELNVSGAGETPAYRGTAYMVVGLEDLTNSVGAIPQYRYEVSTTISPSTPGSDWFDYVTYTGDGGTVSLNSLNLYEGGLVWVNRLDAAEPPMMFYKMAGDGNVFEMGNKTIVPSDPVDNPVISDAAFNLGGSIDLPDSVSTPGGSYIAYVFLKSDGNFTMTQYSGNGTSGNLIPHDLGTTPKMHFIRQLDDPSYTIGFMHLEHFNGLGSLHITDGNNIDTDAAYWNNAAPTSGLITLGNHPQINGTGKQYVMFLFGGDDCYTSLDTAGTELDVGFDPAFAFVKRRISESSSHNYKLLTGTPNPGFDGDELLSNGNEDGGVSITEDRILRIDSGVYEVSTAGGASGSWVATSVDVFMIRGVTTPPAGTLYLSDIVSDLHDRCGIPTDDYDVTELTDEVEGLTLTGDYTAADGINTLRSCYFFDKAEPGDKLYYPKRGKAVVTTLDFDDLIDVPDLSKRDQVAEVPKKVHLLFQNSTAGYSPVKATYERSTVDVKSIVETTIEVPVVLTMDQGQQMVHKQHKVLTSDAQAEIKLTIPDRLIKLIPSDSIGLSLRGQVRRLRIDDCEWADGVLTQTLRADRQSAYTSNLTGIPIPEPMLPPSTLVGDTTFVFADVSSRIESEDDLHYLVAGVGSLPGWYGWMLQRSLDAGANYSNVEQFNVADIIGSLVDDVPAASEHYTDTTNTVRVQLFRDGQELEDITEAQFLSEGGAFLLEKADGSYEVMQYRDAVVESDGSFLLSTLHRGRLNSGAAAHTAGARFVMMSSAHHIPAQSAWIGQALTHRPVSLGESAETATEQTDTYVGRSQLEWPVASLSMARDVSDVITATWAPRHRFGTDDAPVASINFQGFRVTLDDGVLQAVTFDTTTAGFTYDASALGSPLTVSVSALNRITGAGPVESGTV
jgi:hypothetical protein